MKYAICRSIRKILILNVAVRDNVYLLIGEIGENVFVSDL